MPGFSTGVDIGAGLLGGGSQRKLFRASNGNIFAFAFNGGINYRVSTDNGVTFSNWAALPLNVAAGYEQFSVAIDEDDNFHVVYIYEGGTLDTFFYARYTPNAGRTSLTLAPNSNVSLGITSNSIGYADIFAHREGTGWVAHVVTPFYSSGAGVRYVKVAVATDGTVTVGSPTGWTGTGGTIVKTFICQIPGSKDLYIGFYCGTLGTITYYAKLTYNSTNSTWALGTYSPATSNSTYLQAAAVDSQGRLILAGNYGSTGYEVVQIEKNGTITALAPQVTTGYSLTNNSEGFMVIEVDSRDDIYLFFINNGALYLKKYTRATSSWGAAVQLIAANVYQISMKRNSRKGRLEMLVRLNSGSVYYHYYEFNSAPSTPPTNNPRGTQASPATLLTTTPILDWSFSDTDAGDTQSAYQVKIKDVAAASYVHDTGKVVSTATDYVVPGGVITAGKVYSWEVSTWDTNDLQSAFSSAEYFQVVPPAAVGDKFTFNYTGGGQTFQIPGNVTKVKLEAWGAQGGNVSSATGGKGGYSVGELTTTPGQVLHLYVGGKGGDNISGTVGGTAGYNGGAPGGAGSSSYRGAGGGGGGTDIRIGGTALANRILIAGGGGGGGGGATATYNGGAGGGTAGGDGQSANTGGTQTAGGTSPGNNAQGGTLGQGGQGTNVSSGSGGGSGGGGYYGGAGGLNGHGGGGGSGYVSPTLTNASTTANQRTGDGLAVITVLEATDPGVSFVNRSPGTTDQANPGGANTAPTFAWDYNVAFTQTKYQVKVFDGATVVHDSGPVTSAAKSYAMPAGILTAGHVYGWEVTTTDQNGSQYPSNRLYFITNYPPSSPTPDPITDNLRVGKRPVFSATVADDVENDSQAFILQLATDSGFTTGLLTFDTTVSTAGWEYNDGTRWLPFPADGKLTSDNEGCKIRYTPQADLVEGTTYYWRMASKDGTTNSLSEWVGNTRIRCGNQFLYTAKTIKTTAPVDRIVFSKFATISDKVTVKLEVTNNAYDEAPAWEDATDAFMSGDYYRFTNTVKTATDWGLAVRLTIDANDELGPIALDAIGYSWD